MWNKKYTNICNSKKKNIWLWELEINYSKGKKFLMGWNSLGILLLYIIYYIYYGEYQ